MKTVWLMTLLLFAAPLFGDRVLFKNGTFDTGKIEAESDEYIIFTGKDDVPKKIRRSDITELIHDEKAYGPGKPAQGTPGLTLFNFITLRNFTGALTLGWEKLSLSDLNDTLMPRGYAAVPENNFKIGGIGQVTISRVVLGMEGAWLWGAGREAQIGTSTIRNSFSAFKGIGILGYLVYKSEYLDIFPYLGFGLAGYNLMMTNTMGDSFGNIVATGQRGAVLSSLSLLVSPGVQLTWRVPFIRADKGVFGLALGAKAGYDIAFAQSNWAAGGINDFAPVTGGPKTALTGPFAQAIIGLYFDFY